jgi:SPP1 family phage portal protein
MLPFENKCVVAERKFSAALRRQMQILSTAWAKKGLSFAYTDIDFVFKRNFPLDLRYEAETTALLRGHVSEKTRLSQLSFVNVPEDEIAEMQAESGVYSGGLLDMEDEDETEE